MIRCNSIACQGHRLLSQGSRYRAHSIESLKKLHKKKFYSTHISASKLNLIPYPRIRVFPFANEVYVLRTRYIIEKVASVVREARAVEMSGGVFVSNKLDLSFRCVCERERSDESFCACRDNRITWNLLSSFLTFKARVMGDPERIGLKGARILSHNQFLAEEQESRQVLMTRNMIGNECYPWIPLPIWFASTVAASMSK